MHICVLDLNVHAYLYLFTYLTDFPHSPTHTSAFSTCPIACTVTVHLLKCVDPNTFHRPTAARANAWILKARLFVLITNLGSCKHAISFKMQLQRNPFPFLDIGQRGGMSVGQWDKTWGKTCQQSHNFSFLSCIKVFKDTKSLPTSGPSLWCITSIVAVVMMIAYYYCIFRLIKIHNTTYKRAL